MAIISAKLAALAAIFENMAALAAALSASAGSGMAKYLAKASEEIKRRQWRHRRNESEENQYQHQRHQ